MARDPEIEKLLAEREIQRTMARYAHAVDYQLEDEWVDCFTEDGTYGVTGDVLPEWVRQQRKDLHGRAALRAFIAARSADSKKGAQGEGRLGGVAFQKHLALLPLIEVDGDRATAVTYEFQFDSENGLPVFRDLGRYRDTFVKCPDGRWRIEQRTADIEGMRKIPTS